MPASAEVPASTTLQLELTRTVRARRARVFQAWTDPALMLQWMPPGTMVGVEATSDPRPGGEYRISMQGTMAAHNAEQPTQADDPVVSAWGVYQEVVPDERLVYTWHGSWNPTEDTRVTVSFRDTADGTEIHLLHEGFTTEQAREAHLRGWQGSLVKLPDFVAD